MQILITGRGVDLTEAIQSYVDKKLNGLEKFLPGIIRAEVIVAVESQHHHKGEKFLAECKLEVPGNSVFAKKEATTLYEAIDMLKDQLEAELKKHKVKLEGNLKLRRTAGRSNKEYQEE